MTNKQAYDKLIKARTILLVTQPFFGCLALHLELVECPENSPLQLRTMAVDGAHMFYFPEFVLKLSEEELVGVVAHEVLHCAFQHMTRRQHRNPVVWNFAGDYVINDCLLKAAFTLPKPHLHDPKYADMSTEEVYERVKQDVQKQIQQQGKGGGGNKGQKSKGKEGSDKNTIYLPDTDLDIDPGNCGGVIDAAGPGDKHKTDKVSREWDANVRMAVNVAKRANAGTTPGYLERLVTQLQEPKVSWRELTRQFIDNSMSKDYSWSRPNRRFAGRGLHLPGFISDALHHLIMVADTSGSIDEAMMKAFVSEVSGALNDGTADKLTVLYADTQVRHVDEYVPGDLVACKIIGGGGTDFKDSFRWIKENAPDAACVVYLTDMLTSDFGEDPGIPTLWACYLPAAQLATIKPPFGSIVPVDTSE
jgi:predicted metal-dependent peptidase